MVAPSTPGYKGLRLRGRATPIRGGRSSWAGPSRDGGRPGASTLCYAAAMGDQPAAGTPQPRAGSGDQEPARPAGQTPARPAGQTPGELRIQLPTQRAALVIAAGVIVAFLLWQGREVLTPFIFGALIIFFLAPAVDWLSRRGIGRGWAVLLIYAVAIAAIVAFVVLAVPPLVEQIGEFVDNFPEYVSQLQAQFEQVLAGIGLPTDWIGQLEQAIRDAFEGADWGSILYPLVSSALGLVGKLAAYLLIPAWAFYILKDRPEVVATFGRALPHGWRDDILAMANIVARVFRQWGRGQLILGLVVGVATFIGLTIMSFWIDPVFGRFALLFAVLAGLLELLPNLGPVLSAIPALVLAATISPFAFLVTLLLYLGIQQTENIFLVPRIQGSATSLHPAVVLFALFVGAAIAGLIGAILSIPIAAAGRDIYLYMFRRLGPPGDRPTPQEATDEVFSGELLRQLTRSETRESSGDAAV
jgi:predicted PurR-regulated permease PerM